RILVLGGFHDADDLVIAGVAGVAFAKVLSEGIAFGEVFLSEGFIDHGNALRRRGVTLGKAATAYHRRADRLKIVRAHTVPRRVLSIAGMAQDVNAFTPIVGLLRRVEREALVAKAGQVRETVFDLLIKTGEPFLRVARARRVELDQNAPLPLKTVSLVLQVAQTLRQQTGNGEQHQGESRLHH